MSATQSRFLKAILQAPVHLYRWRLGWLLGKRFLLLTHIGRRTGRTHQVVVEVMDYRREIPEAIVMSGFGRNADWLLNIQAHPEPQVQLGSQTFAASFRFLDVEEAMAVVHRYERKNWFMLPIVRYVLSRLLRWRYLGTAEDRRRLVAQLPLIGFRPKG